MSKEGTNKPLILVILGVSGDLSRRYLLPGLKEIAVSGKLPAKFKILGITRQDLDKSKLLPDDEKLTANFELYKMDVNKTEDYKGLKQKLNSIATSFGDGPQIIFYFAVPPASSLSVIDKLGENKLNGSHIKLLLEKPFGTDLASAKKVIAETTKYFKEDQIYRIDHYLAKEMAQNITVFLSSNALFRNVWSNQFIDHIEIIAAEKIGIEGRGDFYEQTGALKDVLQSHLLQLAALTIMEACPDPFDFSDMPSRRLKALKSIKAINPSDITRAQYAGYKEEAQNNNSLTESFVYAQTESDDPRWVNVPIILTTGKALDEKLTAICVHFKKTNKAEANLLMLRVQPNEGIEIDVWVKKPGYEHEIQKQKMQFSYSKDHGRLADAYEQVLVEAIEGSHVLFAGSEEILESWRIIQPVIDSWAKDSGSKLSVYDKGSKISKIINTHEDY